MGIRAENAELSQRGVQYAQQFAGSEDLPFNVVSRTWKVKVKVSMLVLWSVCTHPCKNHVFFAVPLCRSVVLTLNMSARAQRPRTCMQRTRTFTRNMEILPLSCVHKSFSLCTIFEVRPGPRSVAKSSLAASSRSAMRRRVPAPFVCNATIEGAVGRTATSTLRIPRSRSCPSRIRDSTLKS